MNAITVNYLVYPPMTGIIVLRQHQCCRGNYMWFTSHLDWMVFDGVQDRMCIIEAHNARMVAYES